MLTPRAPRRLPGTFRNRFSHSRAPCAITLLLKPSNSQGTLRAADGYFFRGRDLMYPSVGDVRVSFYLVPAVDVSVIARLTGAHTARPRGRGSLHKTSALCAMRCCLCLCCYVSWQGACLSHKSNQTNTWGLLRGGGDTKAIKQGGRSAHATRQKARWVVWGVLIAGALVRRRPRDRLAHTVGAGAKQPVKVAKVVPPIKS